MNVLFSIVVQHWPKRAIEHSGQQTILIVEPCFLTLLVCTLAGLTTYALEMLSPWVSLKTPAVFLETWGVCQTCSGLKGGIHPSHDAVPTPNSPSKGLLRNMCVLSFVTYSCGHMCFLSASPGTEVSSLWYVILFFALLVPTCKFLLNVFFLKCLLTFNTFYIILKMKC